MSERSGDEVSAFQADAEARRRHRRWFVDFRTTITVADTALPCAVYDLSPGGACVEPEDRLNLTFGDRIEFELPGFGPIPAEVRYNAQGYVGLMFLHDDEGEIEVARYLVAIEQNRRAKRHEARGDVTLRASGVSSVCIVEDLTRHGARVLIDDARHIAQDQDVTLELPRLGPIAATVQQVADREIGLAFLRELAEEPSLEAPEPEPEPEPSHDDGAPVDTP